eukprot:c4018_g1_i1 orf=244-405(+)
MMSKRSYSEQPVNEWIFRDSPLKRKMTNLVSATQENESIICQSRSPVASIPAK